MHHGEKVIAQEHGDIAAHYDDTQTAAETTDTADDDKDAHIKVD